MSEARSGNRIRLAQCRLTKRPETAAVKRRDGESADMARMILVPSPGITLTRPARIASYPTLATGAASMKYLSSRDMSSRPAVLMNCVRVGPGARCVQVTAVPRKSSATDSEKLLTNALLAAYPASSPCGMT